MCFSNSLSTVDIRSIDTIFKFTLWKLCRLMNDSEWCILCLKGMVRKNLVSFATVFQDVTQRSPGVCSLIDHRREPIRMRELLGLLYKLRWSIANTGNIVPKDCSLFHKTIEDDPLEGTLRKHRALFKLVLILCSGRMITEWIQKTNFKKT